MAGARSGDGAGRRQFRPCAGAAGDLARRIGRAEQEGERGDDEAAPGRRSSAAEAEGIAHDVRRGGGWVRPAGPAE